MAEHNNNLETSAIDQPLPTPGSPAPFNIEELASEGLDLRARIGADRRRGVCPRANSLRSG